MCEQWDGLTCTKNCPCRNQKICVYFLRARPMYRHMYKNIPIDYGYLCGSWKLEKLDVDDFVCEIAWWWAYGYTVCEQLYGLACTKSCLCKKPKDLYVLSTSKPNVETHVQKHTFRLWLHTWTLKLQKLNPNDVVWCFMLMRIWIVAHASTRKMR